MHACGTLLLDQSSLHAHADGVLKPLKGLNEYIDWIKRKGIKTAAVTNAPKPNVEAMLKAINLDTFFEHVILGETFEFPKPYPDPYLEALKLVGLQKEDCIIHEDSPAGNKPPARAAYQLHIIASTGVSCHQLDFQTSTASPACY